MEYAVGIDLGGTNIKAVAVNESGEVLGQSDAETPDDGDGDAWASRVCNRHADVSYSLLYS